MRTCVGRGFASPTATALMKADTSISREKDRPHGARQGPEQKVSDYIEQAGLSWDPARPSLWPDTGRDRVQIFWYLVPRGQPISFLGVIVGAGAPFFSTFPRNARPLGKIRSAVPDALEFVARAMRSVQPSRFRSRCCTVNFQAPLPRSSAAPLRSRSGSAADVALERLGSGLPLLDSILRPAGLLQKRTAATWRAARKPGLLDPGTFKLRRAHPGG